MKRLVLVMAGVGLLGLLAQAKERDAAFYQKQFEQWSRAIAELKNADADGSLAADIELIRTWITQGQAFLAQEKLGAVDPLLLRIEAQVEYLRVKLDRISAENAAQEVEDQAAAMEKKVGETAAAAKAAEDRVQALESQGP
jgi:capsule polysaccharide export protein KpsE/RkpR